MTGVRPEHGGERRAAIDGYAILDTPAEEDFDDLALLAAEACAAPIGLVALLTRERQWFKAHVGLSERETSAADAICGRVADEERDVVVVPDLAADPRTADSALVTGPVGARFYAGAALRARTGERLGTLCVLDRQPRPDGLAPRQADTLRRLARQATAQLELRRMIAEQDGDLARGLASEERLADANDVLTISERHWRELFEKLSEGFLVGELIRDDTGRAVDWRYLDVNQAWGELLGIAPEDALGRSVREVLPNIPDEWIDEIAQVCATGLPMTFVRRVGKLERDYEGHAFQLDGDRFAMIFVEITDRLRAGRRLQALLTLGDRLREADSVASVTQTAARIVGETLDATRAGFGRIDVQAGTIEMEPDWTAPGVASVAGLHRFRDYGDLLGDLIDGEPLVIDDVRTDPRSAADPQPMLDLGIAALVNMPVRERGRLVAAFFVHAATPRRWTVDERDFLRNVADRVEVGVARLRAEDRQRVLNQELSHRLKNTLAMVQAIAGQTLKHVAERDAVASFEQRLGALASAHEVLLGKGWAAANLAAVAVRVLEVLDGRDRFRIEGPPVELGARAALSTSLLLHELGTNAVKYGALSVEGGRVSLGWRIEDDTLIATWRERGGPPATTPARQGFGSRLIRLGLLGTGGVDVRYAADGLSAEMRAPMAELLQT